MPTGYNGREGYTTEIKTSRSGAYLCAWKYNGCQGKDYRAFNCKINLLLDTCEITIEDIHNKVLREEVFHVHPTEGWETEEVQFTTCLDADCIDKGMAFAFKPLLLKLGLQIEPDSIWAKVRTKY